ncbi:hypothetical protein [Undibacterium sp.]
MLQLQTNDTLQKSNSLALGCDCARWQNGAGAMALREPDFQQI